MKKKLMASALAVVAAVAFTGCCSCGGKTDGCSCKKDKPAACACTAGQPCSCGAACTCKK